MERRKANSSYAKLIGKEHRSSSLRRSRSMRASFRMLKGKLNHPAMQSPFRLAGVRGSFQHRTLSNDDDGGDAADADAANDDGDEDAAVMTTRKASERLFERRNAAEMIGSKKELEELMSALPLGAVPRKACKLLQIPETYCYKYLREQEASSREAKARGLAAHSRTDWSRDCKIYEGLAQTMHEGIYGTTRMRTATIRKPMPYMNSSRFKRDDKSGSTRAM